MSNDLSLIRDSWQLVEHAMFMRLIYHFMMILGESIMEFNNDA